MRSDLFERRRRLMADWDVYVSGGRRETEAEPGRLRAGF